MIKYFLQKMRCRFKSLTQSKKERRHSLVGPARLWKMKRDFQIKFMKNIGLKPEHYLLEVGCGTLRGGIPLIEYLENSHYFGIEVREEALNEGKKELTDSKLEDKKPTLLLSPDISQQTINQSFDYIWAFSVLFHMDDKILNDTLAFVSKHLSTTGTFYANVNIGDGEIGNWQGFPVVARTLDFYRKACAANGLVVSSLGTLKELGHIANVESQDYQTMLKIERDA